MKLLLYLFVIALGGWVAIHFIFWLLKERDPERQRHYSEWNGDESDLYPPY